MNALLFLTLSRLKNRIKTFFRSPRQLLIGLAAAAVMVIMLQTDDISILAGHSRRGIDEFYALITILYSAVFLYTSFNGFMRGAALFSVADVCLIFPSPIRPKNVMIYGLAQQMGVSILIGLSILFQYSWIHALYGIPFIHLLFVVFGLAVVLFCGQLTAMHTYLRINELSIPAQKKRRVQFFQVALLTAFALPAVLIVLFSVPCSRAPMASVFSAVHSYAGLFPVAGWVMLAVTNGTAWINVCSMVALAAYIHLFARLLVRRKTDYYEDALMTAETEYKSVAARKEGKYRVLFPEQIKLGRTGLIKGYGASALYYKHKLESRRDKTFLFDTMTFLFIGIDVVFTLFFKEFGLLPVFLFITYLQIFSVALGHWSKELVLPYIYMITEPPFIKLLHCLRQPFKKICLEAILLFIPIGLLLGMSPLELTFSILIRISFGCLFTSGCIFVERFFSGITFRTIAMAVYFLILFLLTLPGLMMTVLILMTGVGNHPAIPSIWIALFALSVTNMLVSFIVLFIGRNMLEYAEFNSR